MVSNTPICHSVIFASTSAALEDLCSQVLADLKAKQFSEEDIFAVHLSLEEAFLNAVKHGISVGVNRTADGVDDRACGRVGTFVDAIRDRVGIGIERAAPLVHDDTEDAVRVEEGALYPALHRLERDGLVEGSWGISDTRRRAKFYKLTRKGRKHLERESQRWIDHANAVAAVLGRPGAWSG